MMGAKAFLIGAAGLLMPAAALGSTVSTADFAFGEMAELTGQARAEAMAAGYATSIRYFSDAVAGRGSADGRNIATNALGATDGAFFEIGLGSAVELGFGRPFGDPLSVVEVTFGPSHTVGTRWPESIEIYARRAGETVYAHVGALTNQQAHDGVEIGLSGSYDFLLLVDSSGGGRRDRGLRRRLGARGARADAAAGGGLVPHRRGRRARGDPATGPPGLTGLTGLAMRGVTAKAAFARCRRYPGS